MDEHEPVCCLFSWNKRQNDVNDRCFKIPRIIEEHIVLDIISPGDEKKKVMVKRRRDTA